MDEDQHRFLALLGQLPARLTSEQAAWVLNCQPHDIPILVNARLIKPLGHPPQNGIKYFATAELEKLRRNTQWLSRATDAVRRHWERKNARRRKRHNGRAGLHEQFEFTGTNSPITP